MNVYLDFRVGVNLSVSTRVFSVPLRRPTLDPIVTFETVLPLTENYRTFLLTRENMFLEWWPQPWVKHYETNETGLPLNHKDVFVTSWDLKEYLRLIVKDLREVRTCLFKKRSLLVKSGETTEVPGKPVHNKIILGGIKFLLKSSGLITGPFDWITL